MKSVVLVNIKTRRVNRLANLVIQVTRPLLQPRKLVFLALMGPIQALQAQQLARTA